jgi:hypothetical protein
MAQTLFPLQNLKEHPRVARTVKTRYAAIPAVVGLSIALAACGGGGSKAAISSGTTAPSANPRSTGGSGGSAAGAGRFAPAASGQVAALTGTSMEVQNPQNGQETVAWTTSTRFDQTKDVTVSAINTGDCVSVTGTKSGSAIDARSISITSASSSGSCAGPGSGGFGRSSGGGPGGGGFPGGGGSGSGSGSGSTAPTVPAQLANLSIASGKVTAVSGADLTVQGYNFSVGSFRRDAGASTSTTVPAQTTISVTTTASTTVTERASATSSALAVGQCVIAQGSTGSTGEVTATSISITPEVNGSCRAFGGGGGRFFAGNSAGGNNSGGAAG